MPVLGLVAAWVVLRGLAVVAVGNKVGTVITFAVDVVNPEIVVPELVHFTLPALI